ncbi:MAG: isoprenylcysteine carboxylmethyltransferase family protein [Anaerolineales bacterium]
MRWPATDFLSAKCGNRTERGHQMVQSGPYRYVRHPGYPGSFCLLHLHS